MYFILSFPCLHHLLYITCRVFTLTMQPISNRNSSILFPWKATICSSASSATSRYLLVIPISLLSSCNRLFVAKASLFAEALVSNHMGLKRKRKHKRGMNANRGKLDVELKCAILPERNRVFIKLRNKEHFHFNFPLLTR